MADIDISPLVESWKIANLTNVNFGLVDVPGLSSQSSLPKMVGGEPQWIDALDYTTSDILAASDNFRNALIQSPPLVGTESYKHTHEGSYDIIATGGDLPDATNWHAHSGLDILTAGTSSNADALHTHNSFSITTEIATLISTAIDTIDLSIYVRADGSINQLSDITSNGEIIEAAIVQAHARDHTLLDHTDAEDPFIIANFKKLLDGSNADYYHTHSNLGGTSGISGSSGTSGSSGSSGTSGTSSTSGRFTFTILSGTSWDNNAISVYQIGENNEIEVTKIKATVIGDGGSTLSFNLEERNYGALNSSGMTLLASNLVANLTGVETTTFSNPSAQIIEINDYIVFITSGSAESGTVNSITCTVYYDLIIS